MSIEEREARYNYWRDIAKSTKNPRMRKAAKMMCLGYSRQLTKWEGKL